MAARRTVLVLGDQLNRDVGPLSRLGPDECEVRMVISDGKLRQRPWHRAKLHLILSAMRRFADQLEEDGYRVELSRADSLFSGLDGASDPIVMAPSSYDLRQALIRRDIEQCDNEAFIVGEEGFAAWADGRKTLGLEWFYRQTRREGGWLMEGDQPAGGEWNFDSDNREPPPRDGVNPPDPWRPTEDDVDRDTRRQIEQLSAELDLELYGEDGPRWFAASRGEALELLDDFLERRLAGFGPLEDAVVAEEPVLWHSQLSVPLNVGLLHPGEVADALHEAWLENPDLPLNSVEGFLRQVIGWREYVWGIYWHRMPAWRDDNVLGHTGDVPEAFWSGETDMACVAGTMNDLLASGWTHHIPRLMILGSYALMAGVNPQELTDWFHSMYIDAYDWVMVPNVIGMSQWADGGVMATKPYSSSANYLKKMTTYCEGCAFDPSTRTEDDSCPFNSLYWDFLARHRETLSGNRRMSLILSNLDRFADGELKAITERAMQFRTG